MTEPREAILMAGGRGTRLGDLTLDTNKHLLPIYDQPMLAYPLAQLLALGIRKIVVVSDKQGHRQLKPLLDLAAKRAEIVPVLQTQPRGIAEGLLLCQRHVNGDRFVMMLGDNLFLGSALATLKKILTLDRGAGILGVPVADGRPFAVAKANAKGQVKELVEKPQRKAPGLAVTGFYHFDRRAFALTEGISTSPRGELEITDVNQSYLKLDSLSLFTLPKSVPWFDCGTAEGLFQASAQVRRLRSKGAQDGILRGPEARP